MGLVFRPLVVGPLVDLLQVVGHAMLLDPGGAGALLVGGRHAVGVIVLGRLLGERIERGLRRPFLALRLGVDLGLPPMRRPGLRLELLRLRIAVVPGPRADGQVALRRGDARLRQFGRRLRLGLRLRRMGLRLRRLVRRG